MKPSCSPDKKHGALGKVAYAAFFCLLLPALLLFWGWRLTQFMPGLPSVSGLTCLSVGLMVPGLVLVLTAMWQLWKNGEGLPMNAYPPTRLVRQKLYRWIPHPIYLGSMLVLAGAFLLIDAAAGIWIVLPCFIGGICALLYGFEEPDLKRRFGAQYRPPETALPDASDHAPAFGHRLAAYAYVLVPWSLTYLYLAALLPVDYLRDSYFAFETAWPVQMWALIPYLGAYLWVALVPLAARTQQGLRHFMLSGAAGSVLGFLCFVAIPLGATPRPFSDGGWLGAVLQWQRDMDTAGCAFPSLHVFWAFVAARLWCERLPATLCWLGALLISASCVLTGMHSLVDVVAGIVLFLLADRYQQVYRLMLRGSERIANSWQEWRVGPVRIINHGFYVGLASFLGLLLMAMLLPTLSPWRLFAIAAVGLLGSGLWGQWLEASSQLMRPFGFYGGLFGCVIGLFLFGGGEFWWLVAAFSCAAPLVQAVGRLRCLVQGCCHGRESAAHHGICYGHESSRVVRIAGLPNVPLYPTPLYSIVGNLALFIVLMAMMAHGAPAALMAGIYLLVNACQRFVEEAFRGEPQTQVYARLSIYQWIAVAVALGGIVLSMMPSPSLVEGLAWRAEALPPALLLGGLTAFALGMDFPESNRRMSRLA